MTKAGYPSPDTPMRSEEDHPMKPKEDLGELVKEWKKPNPLIEGRWFR